MNTITMNTCYSDVEIISKILNGEKVLYEVLIRRYNPYLYKVGRSYGFMHEDVEDIMQDTFMKAYQALSKFEERSSFKTWIIRIMLNECYHKAGKKSSQKELSSNSVVDKSTPMFYSTSSHNGERIIANRELGSIIENAVMKIPQDYRLVFSLREMNGLSVLETAKVLNITEINVKVRLNRAKAMLRKELEKMYNSEELFEFNLVYCDKIVANVMSRI